MTDVIERFESAGYDNPGHWTEQVGVGSTVDEDATTAPGTPPDNWLGESLRCEHVTTAENADIFSDRGVGGVSKLWARFDVVAASEGLADGDLERCVTAIEDGAAETPWQFLWWQSTVDSTLKLLFYVDEAGAGPVHKATINASLNTYVTIEVYWSADDDEWELYVQAHNGSEQPPLVLSGSLTSTHPTDIRYVQYGQTAGPPMDVYFDNILESATARPVLLVQGTAAGTLAALTVSAAGEVPVTGSLSRTLDALAVSAAADVPVEGTLSRTLQAVALSGAGAVPVSGEVSASLDALGVAAAGSTPSKGALAETLAAAAVTAAGTVAVAGQVSQTFGALTAAGAGVVAVDASLAATLAALALEGAGQIPVRGDAAVTLGTLTVEGTSLELTTREAGLDEVFTAELAASLMTTEVASSLATTTVPATRTATVVAGSHHTTVIEEES